MGQKEEGEPPTLKEKKFKFKWCVEFFFFWWKGVRDFGEGKGRFVL